VICDDPNDLSLFRLRVLMLERFVYSKPVVLPASIVQVRCVVMDACFVNWVQCPWWWVTMLTMEAPPAFRRSRRGRKRSRRRRRRRRRKRRRRKERRRMRRSGRRRRREKRVNHQYLKTRFWTGYGGGSRLATSLLS
jgi:hypothetical protein